MRLVEEYLCFVKNEKESMYREGKRRLDRILVEVSIYSALLTMIFV